MPILNPQQKAALAAELAKPIYQGLSDWEAAALLNTPSAIDNGPAPKVPAPIDEQAVIQAIGQTSAQKLVDSGYIDRLVALIQAEDRAKLPLSISLLVKSGHLQPSEAQALGDMMAATVDDPAHPATAPGPTTFQALFPGARFEIASGEGELSITSTVSGTCLPEMVAEALS